MQRLHDGAIGDIVAARCYWNGRRPWQLKRTELNEKYGRELTEMEYQLRNWYYFTWLSGDHIAEQHIHNIDVINWAKKGHPVRARAMGGREMPATSDDGEIFDHFAVEFFYEDGSICHSFCRHQPVPDWNSVSEHVTGTKGRSDIGEYKIYGENQWRFRTEGAKDPYQQEHDDLFAAIRNNTEFDEAGEWRREHDDGDSSVAWLPTQARNWSGTKRLIPRSSCFLKTSPGTPSRRSFPVRMECIRGRFRGRPRCSRPSSSNFHNAPSRMLRGRGVLLGWSRKRRTPNTKRPTPKSENIDARPVGNCDALARRPPC
jgi:hypothetical protein